MVIRNTSRTYEGEKEITLQRCLYLSRLKFEEARLGDDYQIMRNCLENLKGDLSYKARKSNLKKLIIRLDKYLAWYDTLEFKYTQKTRDGYEILYPKDIHIKIHKMMTKAYELITEIQDRLGLI